MQEISHKDDLKVTYTNGFHVNPALTKQGRFSIEENVYTYDYDAFFKASQPVIDETCLQPTEFNLIQGIYIVDRINLRTFKKNKFYMGYMQPRDYSILDSCLINLDRDLRKYMCSSLL